MSILCATCNDIYSIFIKKIPSVVIDLIYRYSVNWHNYCEKHQQCTVCNVLVSYKSARHINNYLKKKHILCLKHREYVDTRLKYVAAKYVCWHEQCSREGVEELTCLDNICYSCKYHENDWYLSLDIHITSFHEFKNNH